MSSNEVADAGSNVQGASGLVSHWCLGDVSRARDGKESTSTVVRTSWAAVQAAQKPARGRRRQAKQAGRRRSDGQTGRAKGPVCGPRTAATSRKVLKMVVSLFRRSRSCARTTQSAGPESTYEIHSARYLPTYLLTYLPT